MSIFNWKFPGVGGDWNNSAYWDAGVVPNSPSAVVTIGGGASGGFTVDLSISPTVFSLTLVEPSSGTTALTLASQTLTVVDTVQLDANTAISGYGTISGRLEGGGVVTASGAAGSSLVVSGAIDAAGSATSFHIGSNSTLKLGTDAGATVGTDAIRPTVSFDSDTATFDVRNVDFGNLHLGDLSTFRIGDYFQIKSLSGGAGDSFSTAFNADRSAADLTVTGGGHTETFHFVGPAGWYAGVDFHLQPAKPGTLADTFTLIICFMAGTMIRTPEGETPVETLRRGDLVLTAEGDARPVRWIGRQTVSTVFADPLRSLPIRVRAGALDDNVPRRDLLVSPDHALLVDGLLIHAGALVNGTSIRRESRVPRVFVYYHVELDDHSLIFAENTPAETFVDNVDRLNFDNWAEHETLYPGGRPIPEMPFPRAKAHRQVPADLRDALSVRAERIGATGMTAVA